jgi:hypothetical protein
MFSLRAERAREWDVGVGRVGWEARKKGEGKERKKGRASIACLDLGLQTSPRRSVDQKRQGEHVGKTDTKHRKERKD